VHTSISGARFAALNVISDISNGDNSKIRYLLALIWIPFVGNSKLVLQISFFRVWMAVVECRYVICMMALVVNYFKNLLGHARAVIVEP
jgi:hypothetical protein